MKKIIIVTALLLAEITTIIAQENIKYTFRLRTLMDMAISSYHSEFMKCYYKIEDFRTGIKIEYGKKYEFKTDMAIDDNKLTVKDLLFTCYFKKGLVTFGNSYEPYSLDILISTTDMRFNQSATSATALNNGRRLGLTYYHNYPLIHWAMGIYTNNDINSITVNRLDSWIATSRIVYKTSNNRHISHLGLGASYGTQHKLNNLSPQTINSSGVTSLFNKSILNAGWNGYTTVRKTMIEALSIWSKALVQGEFFINDYKIKNTKCDFIPYGGYLQASYLIMGNAFEYDNTYYTPGRPQSNRALELAIRYNYSKLNSKKTNIYGGSEHDISLGLNYYFNNHFATKANVSYVIPDKYCSDFYNENLLLTQMRLQYLF